jgi:16S rRNA (cytosine967-C5)-methyltransferase
MTDSALLNEAARVLRVALAGRPADAALRETLGPARAGVSATRRRAVSRAVFAFFRWWRWLDAAQSLQKQVAAALDLQARFDRSPATVKDEALAARAVPNWLAAEMDVPPAWLRLLQREPALWIRARRRDAAALPALLGDCAPPAGDIAAPGAFRFTGTRDLFLTDAFRDGRFEIQDLASQFVGHACAPQPGQTWWDACAGEGGKTLHLSDLMDNKGLLWASDRSARRLEQLRKRAARAGVFNYRAAPWDGGAKLPTRTKFDGVLLDAPCSGVGTWQRNPHARWTATADDVRELAAVQARLLGHVAPALKPGGRLVYAVCTLTRAETSAVAEAFTAAHPEFEPAAVFPGGASSLLLWPQDRDANGMYLAAWRRR